MLHSLGLVLGLVAMVILASGTFAEAQDVSVKLGPLNSSGESGTATLSDTGGNKTKVVISVTGQPANVPQPVHVHIGSCAQMDPKPAYGLTTLVDGKSETVIDQPLSALQNNRFAINGHKSAQEATTYVFCGDIPAKQ
jgi:hypothetical protein